MLSIISTENEVTKIINSDNQKNEFPEKKARKILWPIKITLVKCITVLDKILMPRYCIFCTLMLLPILGILLLIPAALAAQSLASHGPPQTFVPLLVSSSVAFAI